MSGTTCLVTGATSGIGKETALRLAALGAAVVIVARDAARGSAARAEITGRVPLARVGVMTADLSSLAQVRRLARRLAGTGVTANCLHPGFVRTDLGRDVTGVLGTVLPIILRLRPGPAAGALTPVYLASTPQAAGVTGGYFVNCKPAEPSALARDIHAAARLWALSESLAGLAPTPG
jgi:NAD(P)-dependent dehydrogenase (short-subunit alcohol dehydrogenase family)